MGTTIFGSYDQLVIEVQGVDRLRPHDRGFTPARLLVPIDLVTDVMVVPAGRWRRSRANVVAEVGSPRHPAVILTLVGGSTYAVHLPDADEVAADLRSCGVGKSRRGRAAAVVAQRDAARPERARRHAGSAART